MDALDLDVVWRTNRRGSTEPPLQVHRVTASTVILRQSLAVTFEAPFLYLLFGSRCALLLDTGDVPQPERSQLRATVDELVEEWLAKHPHPDYELVVAHSHAHGDHVRGDSQFAGRPHTIVLGHDAFAVAQFFGITFRRAQGHSEGSLDLGGRLLHVLPIPGHEPASIALWDEQTELLFTGDTVYPGRLYVRDAPAFAASIDRLCEFANTHRVSAILGAHIEAARRPGRDFPMGSLRHPDEAALPMTVAQLRSIRDATVVVNGRPGAHRFDGFALWIRPHRAATAGQVIRLFVARFTRRG